MQAQLLHLSGPFRGRTITYRQKRLLFGSAADAVVRFPRDARVEKHHAELSFDENGCVFHLKALDGKVFVNHREIREIILEADDLVQLGKDGPQFRFRIHAGRGAACKPVYQMLRDAGEVHEVSGLLAFLASLQRDILHYASWRLRAVLLAVLFLLVFTAAYLGGRLGGGATARTHQALRDRDSQSYADALEKLQGQMHEFRRLQSQQASRQEVDRLREDFSQRAAVVDAYLRRSAALRQVLEVYRRGVCLIHGIYTFHVRNGEELIQVNNPDGTPAMIEYIGSGFLAADGVVVTNRHVVQPWWNNDMVSGLLDAGMVPSFVYLAATFPGKQASAIDPATIRWSEEGVDVAILRVSVGDAPVLPLFTGEVGSARGERVILLGYPTGLGAILARADSEVVNEALAAASDTTTLIAELAKRDAIWPVITQGALNEVTERRLVYDAETTSGGSGGPLFAYDGTVIGVNFAVTIDFQGSNLGVPISFAKKLLEKPE